MVDRLMDGCCRQPEFSGGDRSCWWELTCLGGHVHPSVAAFARTLLAGTYVTYDGDPLRDLTLTAFLDKFVQRKPKVCIVCIRLQLQTSSWQLCAAHSQGMHCFAVSSSCSHHCGESVVQCTSCMYLAHHQLESVLVISYHRYYHY